MNLHQVWLVIAALLPTAGVAFLFYLVIKAMLEGDRRERLAHSRWEAQQDHANQPGHADQRGQADPPGHANQPGHANADNEGA